MLSRGGEQLVPELRDQLLVGRYDVAASPQRPENVLAGRVGSSDQLHDHIGVIEDLIEIALGPSQHADDLRAAPGGGQDSVGPLENQVVEGATHGAAPEKPDADRVAQPTSRAVRSS